MNLIDQLSNVYFITGTNCGGKTTMAKRLSEKHKMYFYSLDDEYWNHRKRSNEKDQPNMNRAFIDWKEYFSRTAEDQGEWIHQSQIEQLEFAIEDLIELASKHERIIVDANPSMKLYREVATKERTVFLGAPVTTIYEEYFQREDKEPILKVIEREIDPPEKAIEQVKDTAVYVAIKEYTIAHLNEIKKHIRTDKTTIEERLKWVEEQFGL